uniref:SWI/SNF complex subunit SMARCC2-like n=1 Tax=Myxine glutinosa TaxID=7769 RepID=UPI0035902FC6
MIPERPQRGGPGPAALDRPERLEGMRPWLSRHGNKQQIWQQMQSEPPPVRSLAALLVQLLQFQEDTCGRDAHLTPFVKIPMKCFQDVKAGGALCHVILSAFKFRSEQAWRRFDFGNPSRIEKHVEMFSIMEKVLIQHGFMIQPTLFLTHDLEEQLVLRLREMAQRMRVTVTDSRKLATHIVYSTPANTGENKSTDWVRPVQCDGEQVLLHWGFMPASYDVWVPMSEVNLPVEDPPCLESPYKVSARWLLDSATFNEWGDEEDYTVDDLGRPCVWRRLVPVQSLGAELNTKQSTDTEEMATVMADWSASSLEGQSGSFEGIGTGSTIWDRRERKNPPKKRLRPASPSGGDFRRRLPAKKGRSLGTSFVKKRGIRVEEEEDLTKDIENPLPIPHLIEVQLPKNVNTKKDTEVAPIRGGTVTDLDDMEDDIVDASGKEDEEGVPGLRFEADDGVGEEGSHLVIPTIASWFDYNSVHSIERRSLPEFFRTSGNKSKTPEIYMAYRNFMVDSYRLSPQEYLGSTACRRSLAGDITSIIRVHALLEQWGIINYQVEPETRGPGQGTPPPTAHFHILGNSLGSTLVPYQPRSPQVPASQLMLHFPERIKERGSEGQVAYGLRTDLYTKRNVSAKSKAAASASRDWTDHETLLLLEVRFNSCFVKAMKEEFSQLAGTVPMSNIRDADQEVPNMVLAGDDASVTQGPQVDGDQPEEAHQQGEMEKEHHDGHTQSIASPGVKEQGGDSEEPLEEEGKDSGLADDNWQSKGMIEGLRASKGDCSMPAETIATAATAALAAAAAKAKLVAMCEEQRMKTLVALLVETQMKKLEIKLRHFEELETIMDRERESLEFQRHQLLSDRDTFHSEQMRLAQLRSSQTSPSDRLNHTKDGVQLPLASTEGVVTAEATAVAQ